MGRVYNVFDKFSILDIIIGFVLGFYLAVNHNDVDMWFLAVKLVFIIAIIMTLFPIISSIIAKYKHDEEFPVRALIEAFILNFAMIGSCLAFGVVAGSLWIGNFIPDNGLLFK